VFLVDEAYSPLLSCYNYMTQYVRTPALDTSYSYNRPFPL